MPAVARTALIGLAALALIAGGLAMLIGNQDERRSNDRVLHRSRSPDRAFDAFLVIRVADSLSADVLKVFVAPAGRPWSEGERLMIGRRFSTMGDLHWLDRDHLCLVATADGIEEQTGRTTIDGRELHFAVHPSIEACVGP